MNVYEIVTERIISQMEQGVVPWHKSWMDVRSGAFNRVSKRSYSLLNQMLLSHKGEYATFRQWSGLGGHVKKGAKAEMVVFWKLYKTTEMDDSGELREKTRPVLRYYNVFHISDVEGVDPLPTDGLHDTDPIPEAEKIFHDYVCREHIGLEIELSNEAYYSPARDVIHLPDIRQYENAADYYGIVFHESAHSTGHASRLGRFGDMTGIAPFGSPDYSKEELVAELGSAAILNTLGLETTDTFNESAAYIQNWIRVLKDDTRFIISASSKADKAVNYILGREAGVA